MGKQNKRWDEVEGHKLTILCSSWVAHFNSRRPPHMVLNIELSKLDSVVADGYWCSLANFSWSIAAWRVMTARFLTHWTYFLVNSSTHEVSVWMVITAPSHMRYDGQFLPSVF
jgi:hypothetical protein